MIKETYDVTGMSCSKNSPRRDVEKESREMKIRLTGSVFFLIIVMTLGMSNPTIELPATTLIVILNRKFFIAGFRNLIQLAPNEVCLNDKGNL